MAEREPFEAVNIDENDAPPIAWSRVLEDLSGSHGPEQPIFLATVRPDGRPHVVGIGISWVDGDFYFTSGPQTVKSANLAQNPQCTIAGRIGRFDISMDGIAERITDRPTMERAVEAFQAADWPATIVGDQIEAPFNAQTAGKLPWNLYRFRFSKVIALGSDVDGQAMRFRFAD